MTKINKIYWSIFVLLIAIFYACSSSETTDEPDEEEPKVVISIPTLETYDATNIESTSAAISGKVLDNGGESVTERGICFSQQENPTYADTKSLASSVSGSGQFSVNISNLEAGKVYYARAYAVNSAGVGYGTQVSFITTAIIPPTLKFGDIKVAAVHDIWLDVEAQRGDLNFTELGLVYSASSNPTVDDNKITTNVAITNFKQRITGLDEETLYYFKPYAITENAITYGDEFAISTIKAGNFTWSFWWEDDNADAETKAAFDRIRDAFDEATWYYNNFTSIVKHVNVNYNTGTPTADANFDGWINMGPNASYQRTGTAMHEMAHTVGVGTHSKYWELMQGTWEGSRANEILQMITDDASATVRGDGTHFWPYGINGAHEDDGSESLYITHALIIQGMKQDGLPSN
ncbi:hypothetical protein [Neotamlana nanhaiensis]|uniref:hypothetical protein n=1 Tax=Neotamlana nanhaiensis TaxID=1382798 RepID=UPI00069C0016|nr:hypothetical protein [Tamlana nanhaiensis]